MTNVKLSFLWLGGKQLLPTHVKIDNRLLDIVVARSLRTQTLRLKLVLRNSQLRISAPLDLKDTYIKRFLYEARDWIWQQYNHLSSRADGELLLLPGGKVLYLGHWHKIVLGDKLRGLPEISYIDGDRKIIVYGDAAGVARKLGEFFKKQAKLMIDPLVFSMQQQIGERVKSITYQDTQSRWGSCSSRKELNFCWRIIMAPEFVVKYLVAHEVAHLRELNHSAKFWRLCSQLEPLTYQAKIWLQQNEQLLLQWNFKTAN